MPSRALAERPSPKAALENLEKVVILGDLSSLSPSERIGYYARVCESLGLNPLTRPFEYIELNHKLTLYARRDATDQLRKVNGISVTAIRRDLDEALGLEVVTVEGRDREGRQDSAIGAVSVKGLSGELLANALMKAETKAKRRMTLSLAGLGWLDESELEGIQEPPERKSLMEAIDSRTEALKGAIETGRQDEQDTGVAASPAMTPAEPTLDDVLAVTDGELIEQPGPSASPPGEADPVPTGAAASVPPSAPNPLDERVARARKRAQAS